MKLQLFGKIISSSYRHLSSVDSSEASKFALTAKEWWDVRGIQKGLHAMNRVRVPFVRSAVLKGRTPLTTQPLKGFSILDVGCGGGILSEALAKQGAHVTGIDVVESNVDIAKKHAAKDSSLWNLLSYQCCSLEDLIAGDPGIGYDCVVASEVIEHVANVDIFTRHLCQVVKPGGSLIVMTLNRTFLSYVLAVGVAEYVLNIIPRGTHDWNKFVTPEELSTLLRKNRFQIVKSSGLSYNPFTVRWYFTNDTSINYCVQAVRKHHV